jgi:hypothetical protein
VLTCTQCKYEITNYCFGQVRAQPPPCKESCHNQSNQKISTIKETQWASEEEEKTDLQTALSDLGGKALELEDAHPLPCKESCHNQSSQKVSTNNAQASGKTHSRGRQDKKDSEITSNEGRIQKEARKGENKKVSKQGRNFKGTRE